jgi:hypothetical protein
MSSIIGGCNNTATSTCSSIVGGQGPISTCGSINTQGQAGYQIRDWKEDIMNKYHNRFTIKTEYDAMSFAPIITVIDNNTNKEYKLKQQFTHTQPEETDLFIQQLITDIRETKINNIINGTKD